MTCPRCSSELRPNRRDGIEIDVCTQCRGVWLDRGELDRLLQGESDYNNRGRDDDDDDDDDDWEGDDAAGRGQPRKKRGFFQNLMDNFGDFGGD
jgi:Zn-finger nucleic acid-binding protein